MRMHSCVEGGSWDTQLWEWFRGTAALRDAYQVNCRIPTIIYSTSAKRRLAVLLTS